MARIAKSLDTLRSQVNAAYPNRSKSSDGWIGDTAHSSRASDHNPNSAGVVCAMDLTHDPAHGFDSYQFAEHLRTTRDDRIKYVISNGRIVSPDTWAWRKYTGSNKHDHHVHVSVRAPASSYDDVTEWNIGGAHTPPIGPVKDVPATLKQGAAGDAVKKLQLQLGMPEKDRDGKFGEKTKAAVIAFQRLHGLHPDGIVGIYTWQALAKEGA